MTLTPVSFERWVKRVKTGCYDDAPISAACCIDEPARGAKVGFRPL
jgi:hypothetical protein